MTPKWFAAGSGVHIAGTALAALLALSCGGPWSSPEKGAAEKVSSASFALGTPPTSVSTATSHLTLTFTTLGTCSTPSISTTLGTPLTAPHDALSTPLVSFEGLDHADSCGGNSDTAPSDNSGAIGPHHYVQYVNWAVTVFDRTGRLLAGPVGTGTLFNNTPCAGWSDGLVSYDRSADRWVISHGGQGTECLAISQTGDPTGTYDLYTFQVSSNTNEFYDFQKLGVWSDGYYVTSNDCTLSNGGCNGWNTNNVAVFDRSAMLQHATAPRAVSWVLPVAAITRWVPAFLDGSNPPPTGTPDFVLGIGGTFQPAATNTVQINEVHVDWTTPSNSTFTLTTTISPSPGFSVDACQTTNYTDCMTQPATGSLPLNPLVAGFHYRASYRNFGSHETMVLSDTIAASPPAAQAGIRWYELRRQSGQGWSVFQQGTQAPDTNNRWLGNVGMDAYGDIAVGYLAGGASLNPSIRYAGRLSTDPTGTLPETERSLAEGLGSQMKAGEYGDYSEMFIDPSDDCTFWLTNTYVPVSGPSNVYSNWHTRVGSFRFNTCDAAEPPASGHVAAARQSANITAIFAVAGNGALYDRSISASGSTWSAPAALTGAGVAPAGAGVATGLQSLTQLDVFFVDNNQKVQYVWEQNDGAWQPASDLPGQPANFAPAGAQLATANQGGQLGVLVVDNSGRLEVLWWNPALGWLGPVPITGTGYAPAGASVSVGRRASGELDAFSIGSDGALKYMAFNNGSWSGPYTLSVGSFAPPGGSVASAVDVHGFLNVVTVANDGAVYTKWDCTALWCGPSAITSTSTAPAGGIVSAINLNNSALDVFFVANGGAVNGWSNAGTSWQGPSLLTGPGTASPGAGTAEATQGSSSLDLAVVGTAGLYELTNTGSWSAPSFLP